MTTLKEEPQDVIADNINNTYNEEASLPQSLQPVAKKEEPHETHSFEWRLSDKNHTSITCNKAGTIEDVLKRSSLFKIATENKKGKELVIVRGGRAISSHFPCSLITKKEVLNVMYVKAVDKPKKSVSCREGASCDLVMFHVWTKGGKNVARIMRNPAITSKFQEITVFTYKGEKVKKALKEDGRFLTVIFNKNCVLSDVSSHVNTEMSSLVDDLNGKTFQIVLLNKERPPDSQPSSLEEDVTQYESQKYDSAESQDFSVSKNVSKPQKKPDHKNGVGAKNISCEMPSSEMMQNHLSEQFRNSVKKKKSVPKPSRTQNLLRLEYDQNAQMCREVKTMKKLMALSDSVCHVRVNGMPEGTGFLLFGNYVLTNGHVVKNLINANIKQLYEQVTVHFSFEDLVQIENGRVEVEEIVGFEYSPNMPGCDWALLRLKACQALPETLLTYFGFTSQSGGICIIGHPNGSVKKIDPCLIISSENQIQAVEQHYNETTHIVRPAQQENFQLVTEEFFKGVAANVQHNKDNLYYNSCFHKGSSGSPVFDQHCRVVAMHTGGYMYPVKRETRSVIEFGQPLSIVIENIIVQMVESGRLDVLKEYLACSCDHHENIMTNVMKLLQSRNQTLFTNAYNNYLSQGGGNLMSFFESFSNGVQ